MHMVVVVHARVGRRVGAWYHAYRRATKPTRTRLWHCLHTSPKQWRPAIRPNHCPVSQRMLPHGTPTSPPVRRRGTWSKHIQKEYAWAHSYKYIARDAASGDIYIRIRNKGRYVCVFSWYEDYTALQRYSLRRVYNCQLSITQPSGSSPSVIYLHAGVFVALVGSTATRFIEEPLRNAICLLPTGI